jgi:hypothetical protein
MLFTFDGPNKIITPTDAPVANVIDVDVQDLYSRWVDWMLTSDNSKYAQAMRVVGGDPLPGAKQLGLTYFLLNGWKIRPYEADHTFNLDGNLYSEDGSSPYVSTVGSFNVTIINSVSNLVDSTVQQLPEIEHMAFDGGVSIDVNHGTAGTAYPQGTTKYPVDNLADALTIATANGFTHLYIGSNLTVGATDDISGYHLFGDTPASLTLTLTDGCVTSGTSFSDLKITGVQNGETSYFSCDVQNLSNIHCLFNQCRLIGTLAFHPSAADTSVMVDCYTGDVGGAETIFDLDDSPVHISMNRFSGKLKINNLNKATAGIISINMVSGKVTLDSTCTTGTIKVRGACELVNNSLGTLVDADNLSNESISGMTQQKLVPFVA